MNRHPPEPRIDDEMRARREYACDRRCRWTTYGIETQGDWHSAGCNLNLLWKFRRFDTSEINTQLFNFRDKLGPSHNTYNLKVARFCNRNQASRNVGVGCIYYNPVFWL